MKINVIIILFFLTNSLIAQNNNYKEKVLDNCTTQEINHFYELVFWDNSEISKDTTNECLIRWEDPIYYKYTGRKYKKLEQQFDSVLLTLHNIKYLEFYKANIFHKANVLIEFSTLNRLQQKYLNCSGRCTTNDKNGSIKNGKIELAIDVEKDEILNNFLHEIIHLVGGIDHIKYDADKLMYGLNGCRMKTISKEEIRIIQLIYEINWPSGYTRKDFEEDFADRLYHINRVNKLMGLFKKMNIESTMLNFMLQNLATDEQVIFSKIPKNINVVLCNDFPNEIEDIIGMSLKTLNNLSPNFNLKIHQLSDLSSNSYSSNINLFFDKNNYQAKIDSASRIALKIQRYNACKMMTSAFLPLTYSEVDTINKLQILGQCIYNLALSYTFIPNDYVFNIEDGELKLKEFYMKLFKLYYSPEFSSLLTREELIEAIEEYKKSL